MIVARNSYPFHIRYPSSTDFALCGIRQVCICLFLRQWDLLLNQDGKIVKSYTSKTSSLNNNYVLDIIEHKGQLWIATDGGGINVLDMNSDQIKVMCHVAGDNFSLPVNSIVLLYEDRNGNLWAGSVRGGIFNIKKTYIRTYKDVALNNSNGLKKKSLMYKTLLSCHLGCSNKSHCRKKRHIHTCLIPHRAKSVDDGYLM